jgi:hypothetical protein
MKNFDDRYSYGEKAENAFEEYLKFAALSYVKHINESYWSKEYDLTYGDFEVQGVKIDVKRNSISLRSLDNFKGDCFIVYHHDLHSPMVIETEEAKKLDRSTCSTLSSGDKGFKYNVLRKLNYKTFDEFFKN